MLPRDILRQVRRLHLRARRAVQDLLGGEYRSVFKGLGIAFEEVREYQPGDDIRTIDWNVTARMGHPFVKRFVEERELTVMLMVDCSRSQEFGAGMQRKREVVAELASILAFTALANGDKVGLACFTDKVERFVPPRKGVRHALRIIRDVLFFEPSRRGTKLSEALDFMNRVLHRRAIVFLLSDFLDEDFDKAVKRTARRHDLIAVPVRDVREQELPAVGLMELEDQETGKRLLLDTSHVPTRNVFQSRVLERLRSLHQLARKARLDIMEVATDGRHLDALVRFFQLRERRLRRV